MTQCGKPRVTSDDPVIEFERGFGKAPDRELCDICFIPSLVHHLVRSGLSHGN